MFESLKFLFVTLLFVYKEILEIFLRTFCPKIKILGKLLGFVVIDPMTKPSVVLLSYVHDLIQQHTPISTSSGLVPPLSPRSIT